MYNVHTFWTHKYNMYVYIYKEVYDLTQYQVSR